MKEVKNAYSFACKWKQKKETQTKDILEMENLEKRIGETDASFTNRIWEMEERISGVQDTR